MRARLGPSGSCLCRPRSASRSIASSNTSVRSTARSARRRRYSARSDAVRMSPCSVFSNRRSWSRTGLDAASTKNSTRPSSSARSDTRTHWFCGLSDLMARPAAVNASPSHWKPGMLRPKPRSISASTRRPAHAGGMRPSRRNHVVPHARPHSAPAATGQTSAAIASAGATGSPGSSCSDTCSATIGPCTAGRMRSASARSARPIVMSSMRCTADSFDGTAAALDEREMPLILLCSDARRHPSMASAGQDENARRDFSPSTSHDGLSRGERCGRCRRVDRRGRTVRNRTGPRAADARALGHVRAARGARRHRRHVGSVPVPGHPVGLRPLHLRLPVPPVALEEGDRGRRQHPRLSARDAGRFRQRAARAPPPPGAVGGTGRAGERSGPSRSSAPTRASA